MRMFIFVGGVLLLLIGCNRTPTGEVVETHRGATLQEWINDLRAGDDEHRYWAAVALGEWGPPAKEALPAMIVALKDHHPEIRAQIAKSLIYVDPTGDEVQVHLSAAARDPEAIVRIQAIKSLGMIGPPAWQAVDELEPLLTDENDEVRRAVMQTLGFIGPGAEKLRSKVLIASELDPDEVVRILAEDALKKIDMK